MMRDNDIIVGLGGHIDHGKTTLIKALNGFDGDNLKEEKQRGITLDLSFSSLLLPSRNIAFIDVPGHQKLVKNMIAGTFAIDVLLLVIAANEGIMPQTLEHIRIADMLGVSQCICVITKIDKLSSPLMLKDVQNSISKMFSDCHNIALYDCVALNLKQDADNAKDLAHLKSLLDSVPKPIKPDLGMFVYYVDRSFAIKGAGCVVTGSVLSGSCALSDKLYIYHLDKEVQIKGIQIHDKDELLATPSHRVALNLAQVEHNDIKRGFLIAPKGYLRGFNSIDVGIFGDVKHNGIYQCYLGSAKLSAKVQMLSEPIKAHSFGSEPMRLGTIKCDSALFAIFSQRFILRGDDGSICGGVVLNPIIDPIKKQSKVILLKALANRDFHAAFAILTKIHKKGFGLVSSTQRFALTHAQSCEIAKDIPQLFVDSKSLIVYPIAQIEQLKTSILEIFLRNKCALLSAQSLTLRYKWASLAILQKALDELCNDGHIIAKNGLFLSKNNNIKDIQAFAQDTLLDALDKQHFAPLAPYNLYETLDIDRKLGDSALKSLSLAKKVIRISHNFFIASSALSQMINLMRDLIAKYGYVDVNILREHTHLSRKYVIGYLEYLDKFDDILCEDNKRSLKYAQKPDSKKPSE